MGSHLEERMQKDMNLILSKTVEMGKLVDNAINACQKLFKNDNRQLAYSIIISDQNVDQLEIELDKLCQEFLIKHQPVAGVLRFIYATIKIINELERIGDYAEGIARHYLNICDLEPQPSYENIVKIAKQSVPMVQKAMKSYEGTDCQLAKDTLKEENIVDETRFNTESELLSMHKNGEISSEMLSPLITIASRFERIADRACNICEEVWYICTGKEIKHNINIPFKVLFIDKRDACRAQMATAIGNSLGLHDFQFNSAGTAPEQIDSKTIEFMQKKGYDLSKQVSKDLNKIKDLDDYDILIALSKNAAKVFPDPPSKAIKITWEIKDPLKVKGKNKEINEEYEKTYKFINDHINGLISAINKQKVFQKEKKK